MLWTEWIRFAFDGFETCYATKVGLGIAEGLKRRGWSGGEGSIEQVDET